MHVSHLSFHIITSGGCFVNWHAFSHNPMRSAFLLFFIESVKFPARTPQITRIPIICMSSCTCLPIVLCLSSVSCFLTLKDNDALSVLPYKSRKNCINPQKNSIRALQYLFIYRKLHLLQIAVKTHVISCHIVMCI